MTRIVQAIYEHGVLRPLEPLDLPDKERVTVTVAISARPTAEELLDTEFHAACAREADPSITLEAVRAALSSIPGSLTADCIAERDER